MGIVITDMHEQNMQPHPCQRFQALSSVPSKRKLETRNTKYRAILISA